jgi:hypothetical protein
MNYLHSFTTRHLSKFVQASRLTGEEYHKQLLKAKAESSTPQPIKDIIGHYIKVMDHLGLSEEAFGKGGYANDADRIRDINIKEGKTKIYYGNVNLDEFISEAFTNPDIPRSAEADPI